MSSLLHPDGKEIDYTPVTGNLEVPNVTLIEALDGMGDQEIRARRAETQLAIATSLLEKLSQELTLASGGDYQKTVQALFCSVALKNIKALEEPEKDIKASEEPQEQKPLRRVKFESPIATDVHAEISRDGGKTWEPFKRGDPIFVKPEDLPLRCRTINEKVSFPVNKPDEKTMAEGNPILHRAAVIDPIQYTDGNGNICSWYKCGNRLVAMNNTNNTEPLPPSGHEYYLDSKKHEYFGRVSWEVVGWVTKVVFASPYYAESGLTKTPRTDSDSPLEIGPDGREKVDADFARQLERELAESQRVIKWLRNVELHKLYKPENTSPVFVDMQEVTDHLLSYPPKEFK